MKTLAQKKQLLERVNYSMENGIHYFSVTQRGYGRQSLYYDDLYLMDVYPNPEEHFGISDDIEGDDFNNCLFDAVKDRIIDAVCELESEIACEEQLDNE